MNATECTEGGLDVVEHERSLLNALCALLRPSKSLHRPGCAADRPLDVDRELI